MCQIVLNDDQARAVRQATDPVELCDRSGILLGYVTRKVLATPEEIAEARRRLSSDGPWHTTAEVLRRLARAGAGMTRYTVVWHDIALDELTRLWLAASDRQSITQAADSIDVELARDASSKGAMADADLRELSVAPLRVLFRVSDPDRLVLVSNVGALVARPQSALSNPAACAASARHAASTGRS